MAKKAVGGSLGFLGFLTVADANGLQMKSKYLDGLDELHEHTSHP